MARPAKPSKPAAATKKPTAKKATAKPAAKPTAKKATAKPAAKKAAKPTAKKATAKPAAKKAAKPTAKKATAKPAAKKATAKPARDGGDSGFSGFPADGLAFLAELDENNEREWFERNRARYESSVRAPALAFIAAMGPELARLTPHFTADARPAGGSLMRIHRDIRFSSDKRPYKTNIGMHFRHAAGKDIHAPGIYLHVEPSSSFLGAGLWHPEPEPLAQIRARIVSHASQWRAVIEGAGFRKHWKQDGESLVRPPKGFDPEHEHIEDLRRKDHVAMAAIDPGMLGRRDLPRLVAQRLTDVVDYLRFLCAAVGQPF